MEGIHRNWISSHITDSINSHSQNGLECPISCVSFLSEFPWTFQNNKNIWRKSEAVFKLIFSENRKGKNSHKYYCAKGRQGGGNPSLVVCHVTLWNTFAVFRSSSQMQALNKTQPCWANCFLAASMVTIPANKERGKYVNLNKFTILFPQKKKKPFMLFEIARLLE